MNMIRKSLLLPLLVLAASAAHANTTYYTGGNCAAGASCSGTDFGSLGLPVNIAFYDQDITPGTTATDDWTFTLPAADLAAGASVTGFQINLQNLAFSGTLESVNLFDADTHVQLAAGTGSTQFESLTASLDGGNYYLEIKGAVDVGSTGSYSGVLVASPVPVPASVWLMAGGLLLCGWTLRRERGLSRI